MLGDALAAAARPAKGGFVRESLTAQYPRLLTLLEGCFQRIATDSKIKVRHALALRVTLSTTCHLFVCY